MIFYCIVRLIVLLGPQIFFRFNIHHAFFLTNMYVRSMHSKMFSRNNVILNLLSKNILEIDWKFLIADIWPQTRSKETPKRTSSSITPTFNLRVRDNQDTSFGME